jgi:hypothetical protein
MCHLK